METQQLVTSNKNIPVDMGECVSLVAKINGIVGLMLLANENGPIDQQLNHGALWAISDYTKDLENLCEHFSESVNE